MSGISRKSSASWAEIADIYARLRQLKDEFAVAHEHGMRGLTDGNHEAFSEALERERAIINEQAELLRKIRRMQVAEGKP